MRAGRLVDLRFLLSKQSSRGSCLTLPEWILPNGYLSLLSD